MKRWYQLIVIFFTLSAFSIYAQEFYIAPTGSDTNPGTQENPFKSLARARDAVRELNKVIPQKTVIYLRGGEYKITEAVKFGPQDSGFHDHKIIYRAFKDEKPILTGGVRLADWALYNKEKNIYRATTPKTRFRQVYIDNNPAIRARTPNRKSETNFGPYWKAKIPNEREINIGKKDWETCANVKRLDEVELVIESHWYHQRIHIGQHKSTGESVIIMPAEADEKFNQKPEFYKTSYFYFENALDFIDTANEWYHDENGDFLYLGIEKGINPNNLHIEVPITESLVEIHGTPKNPVHDIEFQGITFQSSNWSSPSKQGMIFTQFAQPNGIKRAWENTNYPSGIIRIAHARQIAFRNNLIRNTGAHGIQLFENVDDSDIEGNQFYQIAANGIEVDAHAKKNPVPEQQSTGIAIWNNHIWKAGQNYTNGGGILAHNVRNLIIEHNLIHDMPYSCMQIGNQPGKGPKAMDIGSGDNVIRYNHVHHCMQLHDDGGGIYTLGGIQKGSVIAENYLHDITSTEWAGSFKIDLIYLDNRTSQILVKDNVVNGGRAAERNGSKGNILMNNTQSNTAVEKNAGIKLGYSPRGN